MDHPAIAGGIPVTLPVWGKYSCGIPVVFEQPSEPFPTDNRSSIVAAAHLLAREQQDVPFSLVIPLLVKMCDELSQNASQRSLPEQDEFRQAFLLHGPHPSFRVSAQVRTARRQSDRPDAARRQRRPKRGAELRVPIVQGVPPAFQWAQFSFVALRAICCIQASSGCRVIPAKPTRRLSK